MNIIESFEVRDTVLGVDQGDLEGDFVKHIRYLNYTNEVVKIRDRSGFIVHLNPAYSANYTGKDGLVVRVEMHFNHNSAKINYERIIGKPQSERDILEVEFARKYVQMVHQLNRRMIFITYVLVEKEKLVKNSGQNFLTITDTAVFIGTGIENMDRVFCPGSEEEYLVRHEAIIQSSEESEYFNNDSLLYSVRVVDNTSEALPEYWSNVFNSIVPVRAQRCPGLRDGIYITTRTNNLDVAERSLEMEYCPIENRLKIDVPLYLSKEEAMNNYSHPERIFTSEQAREQAAKASKMEREEEMAKEKLKAERERQNNDRQRFEQEEKAQKRKNTFEMFKYGPMLINGIIVLVTLIVGFLTKTPIRPVKI